jgi:hypothetical protein
LLVEIIFAHWRIIACIVICHMAMCSHGYRRADMSEAKHTPGPWEAANPVRFMGTDFIPVVREGDDLHVCEVYAHEGDKITEIEVANARLIAAAPDLLDALKMARSYIIATGAKHWEKDLAKVDAAIAKAEGAQ